MKYYSIHSSLKCTNIHYSTEHKIQTFYYNCIHTKSLGPSLIMDHRGEYYMIEKNHAQIPEADGCHCLNIVEFETRFEFSLD